MKCTRETENKVRHFVTMILLLLAFIGYCATWWCWPQVILSAHIIFGGIIAAGAFTEWLAGDINFCKGKRK